MDNDARGYHAFHWLEYGYLQKGDTAKAKEMVLKMKEYMDEKPSNRARSHMVFLMGTYLSETNDWSSHIADIPVDIKDLNIRYVLNINFYKGVKLIC